MRRTIVAISAALLGACAAVAPDSPRGEAPSPLDGGIARSRTEDAAIAARAGAPASRPAAPPAAASFSEPLAVPPAGAGADPRALSPGDAVEVVVHGSPDLSLAFAVPAGGKVTFPPLGPVEVAGRNPFELESAIAARLRDEGLLVDPKVAVLVKAYAPRRVYVLDGVRRPSEYDLPEGKGLRLTQAIALAGGFLETARRDRVAIFRAGDDGSVARLAFDANAILEGGAPDPAVLPDDTIVVAVQDALEERVFVAGRVKNPGAYSFRIAEGITVLRAVVLAGGFDKYADAASVVVVRAGADGERRHVRVDLKAALAGQPGGDLALQPGDVVIVPESFF